MGFKVLLEPWFWSRVMDFAFQYMWISFFLSEVFYIIMQVAANPKEHDNGV